MVAIQNFATTTPKFSREFPQVEGFRPIDNEKETVKIIHAADYSDVATA
jgi:hypothetical protein